MMATQSKAEHGVIQSSIALLQERFRQLQRVKEMRESRELVRMFSEYKSTNVSASTPNYNSASSTRATNNNNNNPSDDSTMHYNDDDDELQIFIPPNNYSNNNRKSSCYFTSASTPVSSHNYHNHINLNEVSLSLWPPASYNNVAADHFRRATFEDSLSTISMLRPAARETITKPCVSSVHRFEDSHGSDVDTTLHL